MNQTEMRTPYALRVAAVLLALGAVGRQLAEDTRGETGQYILLARAATALIAITVAVLASAQRPPRTLRVLAVLIGLTGGAGALGVLILQPEAVLEQVIIITSVMLGTALFIPWSWRWQSVLAGALTLGAAIAVARVPVDAAWSGADTARTIFTVALMGGASVIGAGLADRERLRVTSSEHRYRSLFLDAGDAIAVLDADGILREGNPRLADLLGAPLEQLLNRPLQEFYVPDPARPQTPDHAAALAGGSHSGPRLLRHAGGRRVEVDATFSRIESPTGVAVQAILHDLTNQRAAERQHEHQQRLSALANLAGGLAHQFNNLLAGILTHASVLRDDAAHAAGHGALDEILGAARRGRDLAKELLRFRRNEPITLRPTAVADVLTGVAELARVSVPDTVAIDVRLPPGLPAMAADADHLVHACLELVFNARDAMRGEPTGRITIAAAAETVGPDDPSWPAAAPGRYVRLSVTDTGVGMDSATLERMFEPFFTTKPMHQAVGMGLPRVYRVMHEHQGSVRIESQRRRGTTVHVLVPVAGVGAETRAVDARTPPAAAPRPAALVSGSSATVLVVDDEEIVRSSLTRALSRFGYRVLGAWDGPTALATLQSANPPVDLVILDLVLPGGGSAIFELLKAVRPDIKVLVSSGYTPDEAHAKTLAGRADGFLPKPYEIGELRTAVARALGRAA